MKLVYENKEDVPADSQESFVEFQQGDKTVFMHSDLAESKKKQYRLQGDLTTIKGEADSVKSRLSEIEQERENQRKEAEKKKFEKQKANNQHDEIIADLRAKNEALEAEKSDIANDWRSKYNNTKKEAIVGEIAALATDKTRAELKKLVSIDISFNESGEVVILGDDGKATSTTLDEYKNSLSSGNLYPSLIKAVSSQGGQGKGSSGVGSHNQAQFGAKIPGFNSLPKN